MAPAWPAPARPFPALRLGAGEADEAGESGAAAAGWANPMRRPSAASTGRLVPHSRGRSRLDPRARSVFAPRYRSPQMARPTRTSAPHAIAISRSLLIPIDKRSLVPRDVVVGTPRWVLLTTRGANHALARTNSRTSRPRFSDAEGPSTRRDGGMFIAPRNRGGNRTGCEGLRKGGCHEIAAQKGECAGRVGVPSDRSPVELRAREARGVMPAPTIAALQTAPVRDRKLRSPKPRQRTGADVGEAGDAMPEDADAESANIERLRRRRPDGGRCEQRGRRADGRRGRERCNRGCRQRGRRRTAVRDRRFSPSSVALIETVLRGAGHACIGRDHERHGLGRDMDGDHRLDVQC